MMKRKIRIRTIVMTVILAGIYLFLLFLLVSLQVTTIIFIDYHTKWKVTNGKWETIEYTDSMQYGTYQVLLNRKEVGEYQLRLDKGVWELYNKQHELSRQYGEVFAYQSKKKVTLFSDMVPVSETDTEMTRTILQELGVDTKDISFVREEKLVFDIDGDGREEVLISAINTDYDQVFGQKAVSLVYLLKDGNHTVLLFDTPNETYLGTKSFSIYGVLQIGKRNTVILSQDTYGEHIPYCHYAFDITKRDMMLISSCQNEVEQ